MHRSRPLWGLVAYGIGLFWGLPTSHTQAQAETQPSEATQSAYDGFIDQALQAYDGGRFAEARTSFRRAHELSPTARTLRTIGMCAFNLGDYVDAVLNLEMALVDTRKPLTDEQRKHATELIGRSNQHVGRFRLRLSPAEATLTVDGHVPTLLAQHELVLESGRHQIDVRAPAYRSAQSALSVEGGDRTTFELRLEHAAQDEVVDARVPGRQQLEAASVAPAGAHSLGRAGPEPAHGSLQQTLGYVTLGVGVAGLAAFGVVGALAIAKQSQLHDHCPQAQCGPAYHGDVDHYETLKSTSTGLLIGGAAFSLLGVGLLLFHGERADDRATLQPTFGLGTIGLRGQL